MSPFNEARPEMFLELMVDHDQCSAPCDVCYLFQPLTPDRLSAITTMARVERRAPAVPTALLVGQWSRKYDRCQGDACRTPDAPHYANGLCKPCDRRAYRERKSA